MKTLGAVLILLLSSAALASPGGGGGGSHGGGGSGGGSHASAGSAGHGGGATRGTSAAHAAASPSSLAHAGTPVARNTATSAKPRPKPGFWKRHFHFHQASAVQPTYLEPCTEEDRRLGRCPKLALHPR
jgi:hypothetical protein